MVCLVTQMSVHMCTKAYASVYVQGVRAYTGIQCIAQMCTNAVSTRHLVSSNAHKVTSKSCRGD